ncbi:MAG: exodeoxyribonuclease VII small subunit [Lachnospiraceae bacterium]|nr:exodeoxyribonuclease VII small subunit [Lachnospiraceae bacterium]
MPKKNEEAELNKLSLDQKMDMLDEIIEKLETGEATLEESFALYKQGIGIVKNCNESIDHVEKEVLKINEDGTTERFPDMDGE